MSIVITKQRAEYDERTYSSHDRALVSLDLLVKLAKGINNRVEEQVLTNVLVLES